MLLYILPHVSPLPTQSQFRSSFVSAVEQDKSASEENYAAAGGAAQLNASLQHSTYTEQMIQPAGMGGASRVGLGSDGPQHKKKKRSRWDWCFVLFFILLF